MKETEKYISYQVMTNNLILTKPYYDIKGNKLIELKIKNLFHPYVSFNINSNLNYNITKIIFLSHFLKIKNFILKIKMEKLWVRLIDKKWTIFY